MKRLLLTILALTTTSLAAATAPLIPLQARITRQDGTPYTDGRYTLTFNLYSTAVGGATAWTERHEQVGVINGMINVFLGSIEPLPSANTATPPDPAFFSTTRYLGITIDSDNLPSTPDPEMVPRQIIIPAFHANNADKLAGHGWEAVLGNGVTDPTSGSATLKPALISDDSITQEKLAAGSVGSEELADGSISFPDIAPPGTVEQDGSTGQSGTASGQIVFGPEFPAGTTVASGSGWAEFTSNAIEIQTRGGPVAIALQGGSITANFAPQAELILSVGIDLDEDTEWMKLGSYKRAVADTELRGGERAIPASIFRHIHLPPGPGIHRYTLRLQVNGASATIEEGVRLVAYELR